MAGEAYSKRYGSGGFVDLPSQTTAIDSQYLNGTEAALARLLGADPTDKGVQVWDATLSPPRFKTILLTAANLDPAAAIAKSQLAPLAITDADVAAGANIASSKIGGNIPLSKLAGSVVQGIYRKTTIRDVPNTITESDLLNGEITVAAGVMGLSGMLRLTAWGDWINASGSAQLLPRFKAKLGATTIFDTSGTTGTPWANSAQRWGWRVQVEIMNLGATNSQWATFSLAAAGIITAATATAFATGEGIYMPGNDIAQAVGTNSSAVDTTVAQVLALTVINPVLNVSVGTTLHGALVELI